MRVERDVRGFDRRDVEDVYPDRTRTRDGHVGPSRPEGHHSGTHAQKLRDAVISELQRQVRDLQQQSSMRGPPPRMLFAPAAMGNSEVPCAAGPVEAPPDVTPCQSKAPQIQSRRQDGESEAVGAKFHGAPGPSRLYRDPIVRLSPAYLKPDEGNWDQPYLSKVLQQMKDSEIAKLKL